MKEPKLKKLWWRIVNYFIRQKVRTRFGDYDYPDYNPSTPYPRQKVLNSYNFCELKELPGHVLTKEHWGSAPSYTDSVFCKENVSLNSQGLEIQSRYHKDFVTGKTWGGFDAKRYWSSGMWYGGVNFIEPGLCYRVVVKFLGIGNYGYWPCPLWLFQGLPFVADEKESSVRLSPLRNKDKESKLLFACVESEPLDPHPYFEIDGFETVIRGADDLFESTVTLHSGNTEDRWMLASSGILHTFMNTPPALFAIDIIFTKKGVEVYWNNLLVFRSNIGVPDHGTMVFPIISDAVVLDENANVNDVYGFVVKELQILKLEI